MIRIVVLDKNFVSVGRYSRTTDGIRLTGAHVIRIWGTERGLGQIAADGPTGRTILDKTPPQEIPWHAVIKTIECDEGKWAKVIGEEEKAPSKKKAKA